MSMKYIPAQYHSTLWLMEFISVSTCLMGVVASLMHEKIRWKCGEFSYGYATTQHTGLERSGEVVIGFVRNRKVLRKRRKKVLHKQRMACSTFALDWTLALKHLLCMLVVLSNVAHAVDTLGGEEKQSDDNIKKNKDTSTINWFGWLFGGGVLFCLCCLGYRYMIINDFSGQTDQLVTITIPQDWVPGTSFPVTAQNGETIDCFGVPAGKGPGDTFELYMFPQMMGNPSNAGNKRCSIYNSMRALHYGGKRLIKLMCGIVHVPSPLLPDHEDEEETELLRWEDVVVGISSNEYMTVVQMLNIVCNGTLELLTNETIEDNFNEDGTLFFCCSSVFLFFQLQRESY